MSNPIPSQLALTTIADSSLITAAPHRNNYSAIQSGVNGLITALSGGSAGQVLQAVDGSDVQWHTLVAADVANAADKSSGATQTFSGPIVDTAGLTTGPLSGTFSGSQTAGVNIGAGNIVAFGAAAFTAYKVGLTTDTQPRYQFDYLGAQSWGPGGSTALDTTLTRQAAGQLGLANKLMEGVVTASQGGGTTFTPSINNGLIQRINQSTSGTLTIGSPGTPPANFGSLLVLIIHNGTAGTITLSWNAIFRNPPAAPGAGVGIVTLWAWNAGLSAWCLIFSAAE